jgi:hypothetical protein
MKLTAHIHKTVLAGLCTLVLSPALLFAADTAKPLDGHGIIKTVDLNTHQMVVTEPKKKSDQTFQWNEQTKFSEQKQSASASALKAGEHIQFTYATGTPPVLQAVQIAPAKTAKPGANKPTAAKPPGA